MRKTCLLGLQTWASSQRFLHRVDPPRIRKEKERGKPACPGLSSQLISLTAAAPFVRCTVSLFPEAGQGGQEKRERREEQEPSLGGDWRVNRESPSDSRSRARTRPLPPNLRTINTPGLSGMLRAFMPACFLQLLGGRCVLFIFSLVRKMLL